MSPKAHFTAPISLRIWEDKYRFTPAHDALVAGKADGSSAADQSLDDTFLRVARAAASVETGGKKERAKWAKRFHGAMADFGFLPAGRILAGAGTGRQVTLFNCFVMGTIADDLGGIFDHVREAALTMQQGGGIGHDFSTLRPKGACVKSIGADASGPVSFMDVWDSMCRTIISAGSRRGAMMATLRVDHPDIEDFVAVKSDPTRLRNFNLSVLVTDAFMDAVAVDADWDLVFEDKVYRTVPARRLWRKIMQATYDYAEPGVIFIDRVNAQNNLNYCETIDATNPCGEQPLPPYGACLLGSINLTQFVRDPFTPSASVDSAAIEERVAVAVRLLDNMLDVSRTPLRAQRFEADAKRRIGLGVTGLADALIALGVRYGSTEAEVLARRWMKKIQNAAYQASSKLAAEKGTFPLYDADAMANSPNVKALSRKTRKQIAKHGLRNGCLTSIAPTGTISLFAGNVSSGIEPVFDAQYERTFKGPNGDSQSYTIEDYACALYRRHLSQQAERTDLRRDNGVVEPDKQSLELPPAFITAAELSPREHLRMQAAVQPYVDSSISKTINCDADLSFETFQSVYTDAYDLGLKGCTTYRPNQVTGSVLRQIPDPEAVPSVAPPATPAQRAPDPLPERRRPQPSARPDFDQPAPSRDPDVIYVSKPLERTPALTGSTYKLKWPESDHALYITINDIALDGRVRPYEVFINTRHLEHYAWTVALTRMISAVFRRGGDVSFVAKELKEIFDPQGGCWMDGRYVPSLLAAIGEIIEQHMIAIGFLKADERSEPISNPNTSTTTKVMHTAQRAVGRSCPRCGAGDYVRQESCWVCLKCGFSRCN